MNLNHMAVADVPDVNWRVVATRIAIRGRLHDFRVDVFDETGLIASGDHTRAVVIERRVEAIARRRTGRPAMLLEV
jgi:predicted thioesterase